MAKMTKKAANLAMLLGMYAALTGQSPYPSKTHDRSRRNENRMPLDKDELAHLETLSGKDKKNYIKKLREKYS